jgi:hypothetical protein
MDKLKQKYGNNAIMRAIGLPFKSLQKRDETEHDARLLGE